MTPDEAKHIREEIENNDELGTDENNYSLAELDMIDNGELDDEEYEEENEPTESKMVVSMFGQPVTTSVSVGCEVGAKGEVKPSAKVTIERHLEIDGDSSEVYDFILADFDELVNIVKTKIGGMKASMNKGKPEMQ
jgi:hypothetical protein